MPARAAHLSFQVLDPTGRGGDPHLQLFIKCLLTEL